MWKGPDCDYDKLEIPVVICDTDISYQLTWSSNNSSRICLVPLRLHYRIDSSVVTITETVDQRFRYSYMLMYMRITRTGHGRYPQAYHAPILSTHISDLYSFRRYPVADLAFRGYRNISKTILKFSIGW
jgi:hypothetical protein